MLQLAACTPVGLEWDPQWDVEEEQSATLDSAPVLPVSRAWSGPREPEDGLWSFTDPGEVPMVRGPTGLSLPLIHTDVAAQLMGHIADVTVVQTFRNDADAPIEVIYRFPLPENAAVSRMRMVVDGRVVESRIMERRAARKTYEGAKEDGHTAALLEQERPNIFTQSLANVPPGEEIDIEIEYVQTLTYDAGTYEFVFPMVIGPRYERGSTPDTHRVAPSVVGKGTRRGDDFEIQVTAQTGHPIDRWWAPTHEVDAKLDADVLSVELREAETRPNRDFVLRYGVAGSKPRATMFLGSKDAQGQGHFALVVQPPDLDVDALVGRREFIFVVDRSGSMSGKPLALAKETLRDALTHLRPVDTFEVVAFESGTRRLFGKPRPANAANLARATRFLDGMVSGGGTEMGNAIEAALSDDVESGRHRYVMFLTDGYIGFDQEMVSAAALLVRNLGQRGQHARVFGVGMGDAPNDFLIGGLSRAGAGAPLRVSSSDEAHHAVQTFTRWVDHPIVEELKLHTTHIVLTDHHPEDLGGLFASHAAIVHGEYRGEETKAVPRLVGSTSSGEIKIPVRIVDASERGSLLGTLWARAAVTDLELDWWIQPSAKTRADITRIGLKHHIVTAFTSLVAVDTARVVSQGVPPLPGDPSVSDSADRSLVRASAAESRSSGGLSLAGTTAAESKYTVQGANVNGPSFGTVGASIVREFSGGSSGTDWAPRARIIFGRPALPDGVPAAAIRKPARAMAYGLRACYENSADFARSARYVLPIVLKWDHDGVKIQIRSSALKEVRACMRSVLSKADWPTLPVGTTVTLPLRLSAR